MRQQRSTGQLVFAASLSAHCWRVASCMKYNPTTVSLFGVNLWEDFLRIYANCYSNVYSRSRSVGRSRSIVSLLIDSCSMGGELAPPIYERETSSTHQFPNLIRGWRPWECSVWDSCWRVQDPSQHGIKAFTK